MKNGGGPACRPMTSPPGLLERYRAHVPDVDAITAAMVRHGLVADRREIENDHIAFRTMGVPGLGIASLEKVFLHYGYERRDRYEFRQKKVWAHWYAPPGDRFPRIFISQLRVDDLSPEVRAIIRRYTDVVQSDPVDGVDLDDAAAVVRFLHAPLWRTPTWADYERAWDGAGLSAWRARLVAIGADVKRTLLVDAPLAPMRIGRQPEIGDRRPLSEL